MTVMEYVVNSIAWSVGGFVLGFTIARLMTRSDHSHDSNVRALGAVLVLMAVLTVAQTAFFSWKQNRCNEAFTQQIVKRAQWADQDRRALHRLIVSFFRTDSEVSQQRAYENWAAITEQNQEARDSQRLPELADCD